MAHTLSISVLLGAGNTGLTLTPALLNPDGTGAAGLTTANMVELAVGTGIYGWTGTIPDGFGGYLQFASAGTVKTAVALNQQETENADVRTSTVAPAVWDRPRSSHLAAGSFGLGAQIPRTGTAQAGSATTITLDAGASALDNYYGNMLLYLASGTGVGQSLFVMTYVGATKVATMNGTWVTPPDNTTVFVLLPFASLMGGATLTAAAIWAYVTRTLTQSIAAVTPPPLVTGTTVTVRRGDTWTIPFTGLGTLVGRSKLWFTIKAAPGDSDLQAIAQIVEGTGLVRLLGAAGTAGQGSLVVTDPNAGAVTVTLAAAATALLTPDTHYYYDIQILSGATVSTLTTGSWTIVSDVTAAVS